jgi:hypothetical protein
VQFPRRARSRLTWLLFGATLNLGIGFAACGARTGLPVWDGNDEGGAGGGGAPSEGGSPPDAGPDVPEDVPEDVPPPVDDCKDPSTTFIYLVTGENTLWSFNPANLAFTEIGEPDCDVPSSWSPFSMGVDRKGTAYVFYRDNQSGPEEPGTLFRVSTVDAECESTDFEPGQLGFNWFGMGFSLDEPGGETDTLFVAEISFNAPSLGLATIDTETLELSFVGGFTDPPGNVLEMTGSSDAALYAFFTNELGGSVVQFDKTNATILAETPLSVPTGSSLAFAFWNEDFYIFTSQGDGVTTVTRYQPSNGSVGVVTTLSQTVVGAGVSTCDPRAFR